MTLLYYKTQKQLKDYFRETIDKIGKCNSVKTEHPYEFINFCEVFTRHPDYPDKFINFIDIKIDYNPHYKNDMVVYIIKNNGDIDNVSVMKSCISGKPKDNLKIAMRVSIQHQIDEFKNNQSKYICELCNGTNRIEIDHHSKEMPFAKLYIDFMKINTLPIPTSFNDTNRYMACFKEENSSFEKKWVFYHKNNAILRMLCRNCNGSQPKYKK